jgi:dTDP-4-dehydrorhamnose 3,5-epimerase
LGSLGDDTPKIFNFVGGGPSMYKVFERKTIVVEGGNVRRGLRLTDDCFAGFGELYFTEIERDRIKGWKRHTKMVMNLLPVAGEIALYIKRDFNDTHEEVRFGLDDYKLVSIEPNVWVAFKGLSNLNIMANLASIEHDPIESETIPYGDE